VILREFPDKGVSKLRSEIAGLTEAFQRLSADAMPMQSKFAAKMSMKELVEEPEWAYEH
jgi:hypothetical protein